MIQKTFIYKWFNMTDKSSNRELSFFKRIILAGIFILTIGLFSGFSQASLSVSMDTSMMLIGDQTHITLHVEHPKNYTVEFPIFADTIIRNLEIINILATDTLITDQGITIEQKYLVTSFDSGWYKIPALRFVFHKQEESVADTFFSQPLYFGVFTIPLDTVNRNAIADIKAPIDVPLSFKEILPYAGLGFGILVLLLVVYYLYMVLVKKKPVAILKKEKPKEPAHEVALRSLDHLKEQKLWQQGETKMYFIELTNIIRIYIEERFGFGAMEMTTDEIIEIFGKTKSIEKELKDSLFDVLVRADFVKFAKATTLPDENESSINFAYNFILKTKPVVQLRDEETKESQI